MPNAGPTRREMQAERLGTPQLMTDDIDLSTFEGITVCTADDRAIGVARASLRST